MPGPEDSEYRLRLAALPDRSGMDPEEGAGPVSLPVGPSLNAGQDAGALLETFPDADITAGREGSDPGGKTDQAAIDDAQGFPVFALYTESRMGRQTSTGNAPASIPPSM